MAQQIMQPYYTLRGISKEDMARHIGDTTINIAGLVPWCIGSSKKNTVHNKFQPAPYV